MTGKIIKVSKPKPFSAVLRDRAEMESSELMELRSGIVTAMVNYANSVANDRSDTELTSLLNNITSSHINFLQQRLLVTQLHDLATLLERQEKRTRT